MTTQTTGPADFNLDDGNLSLAKNNFTSMLCDIGRYSPDEIFSIVSQLTESIVNKAVNKSMEAQR